MGEDLGEDLEAAMEDSGGEMAQTEPNGLD
jgi:hypothetical protein